MSEDTIFELAGHYRFQWEAAQNAYVLLYPEGMVKLSPSAAEILRRVDGTATLDALCKSIEDAFPGASVRQDVIDFLKVADEHGWIVPRS